MLSDGRRVLTAAGAVLALTFGIATFSDPQTAPRSPEVAQVAAPPGGWVGTWQTAPATAAPNTANGYPNYSIRNVVHTSIGGAQARITLSNAFSSVPVLMGRVTVAVRASGADAVPGTMREVTFGGAKSITIPAGAEVLSDPVNLRVPEDADLLVTTFTPEPSGPVTYHPAAMQTSFLTSTGDHAAEESGAAFTQQTSFWHYVRAVDVSGSWAAGSVVTLGDSITDGVGSTSSTNRRWPDYLADRLKDRPGPTPLGVLNAGISGNRLLLDGRTPDFGPNALARLDRDVLTSTGVRTVILMEGINDIQQEPHQTDPARLIAAYRQIVAQAHARGLRVLGATLTPFKGWRVYDETLEATRQAVNTFIRTSGTFDGVIDFDAALRDPADPLRMKPEYDSGDHLHPGDKGFEAMARAVDLARL